MAMPISVMYDSKALLPKSAASASAISDSRLEISCFKLFSELMRAAVGSVAPVLKKSLSLDIAVCIMLNSLKFDLFALFRFVYYSIFAAHSVSLQCFSRHGIMPYNREQMFPRLYRRRVPSKPSAAIQSTAEVRSLVELRGCAPY